VTYPIILHYTQDKFPNVFREELVIANVFREEPVILSAFCEESQAIQSK